MRVRALRSIRDEGGPAGRSHTGLVSARVAAWATRERLGEIAAVAALFGVALGVRVWLGGKILAPWIYSDEITYGRLAESFSTSGFGRGLEESWQALGAFGYPLVIAPAWLADDNVTAYAIAKGINVGLMTLAAFFVYLIARRLMSWRWALLAATLTLALPFFVYATALMTENAFFPIFVIAMGALMLAIERPTLVRQALVVVAVAAAFATRVQGFVLAGIVLTTVLLCAVHEARRAESGRRLRQALGHVRRFTVWLVVAPVAAVGYVSVKLAQGDGLGDAFGGYEVTTAIGDYGVKDSLRWIVFTFADLSLSVGLIPMAALIVLFVLAFRAGDLLSGRQRIFVFATGSAVVWLVVQVGIFSSRFSFDQVPQERSVAYVVPFMLVATVLWLERGLPRPALTSALALAIPAIAVVALPLERMLPFTGNHAFGLFSLWVVQLRVPTSADEIRLLLAVGLALAVILVALPLRQARIAIPAGLLAFLVLSSLLVFAETRKTAQTQRGAPGIGAQPDWIDRNVGADAEVPLVYSTSGIGLGQLVTYLQADLWNRSVSGVDSFGGDQFFAPTLAFDRQTGAVSWLDGLALDPEYVVIGNDVEVAGDLVASVPPLALYRLAPPFRIASTIEGRFADLWTGAGAVYTRFATPDGGPVTLDVWLSREGWSGPDVPGTVVVRVGPLVVGEDGNPAMGEVTDEATWEAHAGQSTVVTIDTPPPPFRVEVSSPTFSPAQFGLGDTRQLGVQLTIAERDAPG